MDTHNTLGQQVMDAVLAGRAITVGPGTHDIAITTRPAAITTTTERTPMDEISIPTRTDAIRLHIRVEVTNLSADVIQRVLAAHHMPDLTLISEYGRVFLDGFLDLTENTAPKEDLDPDPHRAWAYITRDSPKMLREALCVAQSALSHQAVSPDRHIAALGRLIDECDRHRPLGNDGKHNDLHTPTCGCETTGRDGA